MARFGVFAAAFLFCAITTSRAADFDLQATKARFLKGEYKEVIEESAAAVKARQRNEEWHLLLAQSLWMTGQYSEARDAIAIAERANFYSIRPRLLGYHIHRSAGDLESAQRLIEEIGTLINSRRFAFRESVDIVALGEAAVILGADPKLVLDNFYTPIKKSDPNLREVYLAIGNLALAKHDYALAGKSFQEGLQKFSKDPDLLHGMAEALAPSDRKEMLRVLEKLFEANENHIAARLLLAEHLVDAEAYDDAETELNKIETVNPNRPEMWAYRGVIAHLKNDESAEQSARAAGLKFWTNNPVVDHIIGRKLSQKYRFAEGSNYQRRALAMDLGYLPARIQLAQDLLRLGEEDEGWKLAEFVARSDAYDVSAYNLVTLHDTISKYRTLRNDHFILRMSTNEADIYGPRALELLDKARTQLTKKYGLELTAPVTVEIFEKQKDFAVRTFGMPGGEGYLGVCFGNVITANSPASHNMNWEAVLWHEFCHVITLNMTRNKMPRWLSEGISVYEERRADLRWGEKITPQYRQLIVEGKMKPISELSSAFMAPPSGLHLQFAYYQSSLVVEFLVERYGLEKIQSILRDLGKGIEINEALAAHTAPMKTLEKDFEEFARNVIKEMGADSVWAKADRTEDGDIDSAWAKLHPENYWVVSESAEEALSKRDFEAAIPLLEKSISIYPGQSGPGSAYASLAAIYREKKETAKERDILNKWARLDGEATEALLRLVELSLDDKDFKAALRYADDLLEINPLHPLPHRAAAEAHELEGKDFDAVTSFQTVLKLGPADRAEIHYRLARLFQKHKDPEARRHILLALEEAPRYRAAHQLLLQITEN
ncbi:MAG TPA: tetratricopeptide repeat protein [Verrucomicrobiae bacterium]